MAQTHLFWSEREVGFQSDECEATRAGEGGSAAAESAEEGREGSEAEAEAGVSATT